MARLVIDARESGTSTGRYIDKLIEYLHQLKPGFEVVVLTKASRLAFMRQIAPEFEVVESNYKEFSFNEQLGFARQLYRLKADLVHFNAPQQPILYFRPSITTVHDLTTARFNNPAKNWLIYKLKQQVYKAVVWWVAHKAKRLIAISSYVKKDLANFAHLNPDKIEVVYEAADKISQPPIEIPALRGKRFLLYVGRPTPHKNLERLIDAMALVNEARPEILLALAGKSDTNYEKLKKLVEDKNLTSQVIFTGFVNDGQLRWLYENALVYVFPSLSEGFGLPGLEAMNYSLPVAASRASCLPEIYKDAARYFDPLNTADMAAKTLEVIDSVSLREVLANKGLKVVSSYSWTATAKETAEIYNKLLP